MPDKLPNRRGKALVLQKDGCIYVSARYWRKECTATTTTTATNTHTRTRARAYTNLPVYFAPIIIPRCTMSQKVLSCLWNLFAKELKLQVSKGRVQCNRLHTHSPRKKGKDWVREKGNIEHNRYTTRLMGKETKNKNQTSIKGCLCRRIAIVREQQALAPLKQQQKHRLSDS